MRNQPSVRTVAWVSAAAMVLGGCSGGSSAATSGAPTTPAPSQPPVSQPPVAPSAHAALTVARRYLSALAEGNDAAAAALAAPAGSAATGRLRNLSAWLRRLPVAHAAGDASKNAARPATAPAQDRAVAVALRARFTGGPPKWVPLGTRVILLAPSGAHWRVADDVTAASAAQPSGLAALGSPLVLRGTHATVVYAPAAARRQALEIRRLADAAVPNLHGTYGGGSAAAHPLIFLVKDPAQAAQVIGRDVGQVLPAGSVAGPFAYVFLRQYRKVDPISRGAVITALMTRLATTPSLEHAPTSLRNGVDSYEQNRYLNSHGYVLPLDRIAAAYPGYPTLARWTSRQPLWGLNGAAQQLAGQDALAMVHVILTRHGGAPALRRLGRAFDHTGSDVTPAEVRHAFLRALGVSFASVVGEAHAYAKGGSWKFS